MADEGWDTILTCILQNQKWFSEEMDPISQSSLLAGALDFSKKPLPPSLEPFWDAFSGRALLEPGDSSVFFCSGLSHTEELLGMALWSCLLFFVRLFTCFLCSVVCAG